jgi:iron(III) transport system permease protein
MRLPLTAAVALLSLFIVVLPVAVLLYTSLVPYSMLPGAAAFAQMSLRHWAAVFDDPTSLLALRNSLLLAVGGATIGVLLSLLIAHVTVRQRSRAAGALETLSFLSFSFPGIVIGIGFMWFFVRTPLYATVWALLIGYIATYLPYGVRPLASALVQVHAHLEESSLVCGASRATTLRRIVAPLLVPGIVSAWILMATMFLRELTLSVVLSRPGSEVLAVQILAFADDGLWGRLSALGMVMIAISTALVVLARAAGSRFKAGMAAG